jgi:hypothetical protein
MAGKYILFNIMSRQRYNKQGGVGVKRNNGNKRPKIDIKDLDVKKLEKMVKQIHSSGFIAEPLHKIRQTLEAQGYLERNKNILKVNHEKLEQRRRRKPQFNKKIRNMYKDKGPMNAPDAQLEKEGLIVANKNAPKKLYLNPSDYTVNTTNLPMIEVLPISPVLLVDNFIDAIWGVGLMALAQGIAPGASTQVGNNQVPTLWFFVLCLVFDLWTGMQGQYSYFKAAPQWYWEIRTAVLPTRRGKYAYQFNVPSTFFGPGGVLPNGLPLRRDISSLQAYSGSGSLQLLSTVQPNVTVDDIIDNISDVCNGIFKDMERLSVTCKVIPDNTDTNVYKSSIGIFAATVPDENPDDQLFSWSRFYIETPVSEWEYWLMFLGWADTMSVDRDAVPTRRTSQYIFQEFQSGCNLTGRILRGMAGKHKQVRWRVKTLFLEQIVWATMTTLLAADEFYNIKYGSNNINNSTFDNSVLLNISPEYLVTAFGEVMRRVSMTNAVFYDNPQSNLMVMSGIKFYAGPYETIGNLPRFIVESLADLNEILVPTKRMGDIHTVVVIGSGGNFGLNPFNNGNSVQYDLTSLATSLNPQIPAVSYTLKNSPVAGMFDYFNIDDFTRANYVGTEITNAMEAVENTVTALVGNMKTTPSSAHVNNCTLMYYTMVLQANPQMRAEMIERYKNHNPKIKIDAIANWTILYGAQVIDVINKYPFSPDQVVYDLTRLLAVTLVPLNSWIPIFKENYRMPGGVGQLTGLANWLVTSSKKYAYPIATQGGAEQDQLLDTLVAQNMGGGFSFLKDITKGVADMFLPGIGGMVVEGLMPD